MILFCTSCGKPLGAVAHIYDDKLLCEECFAKTGATQFASSPAHTVLIGEHDDKDRAEASNASPNENVTTQSLSIANRPISPIHPALMLQGEQILWRRTFSKGIIHRHPSITELITNMRAVVVDDELKSIVRAVPLAASSIVVANTRRVSNNVRTGYGRSGSYMSTGTGSSTTFGDLDFVVQGKIALVIHHIRDPYGIRNLLLATVKSARKQP
jgi:hypothetical protein